MSSRRTLLAAGCGLATLAVAGCLSDASAIETGDGEPFIIVTDGSTEVDAVTTGQVDSVGEINEAVPQDGPVVPITLADSGIDSLQNALEAIDGFSSPDSVELQILVDGEKLNSIGLSSGLADTIEAGEWNVVTDSREEAERLRDALQQ